MTPNALLNDPAFLREALLVNTAKVIALEAKLEEQAVDLAHLDRIAKSDGSMCITDAAKTLQVAPQVLFRWLRANEWIYRRPTMSSDLAYQAKLLIGYLEHKVTTFSTNDGRERTTTQVRVTSKGLVRLAGLLNQEGV